MTHFNINNCKNTHKQYWLTRIHKGVVMQLNKYFVTALNSFSIFKQLYSKFLADFTK